MKPGEKWLSRWQEQSSVQKSAKQSEKAEPEHQPQGCPVRRSLVWESERGRARLECVEETLTEERREEVWRDCLLTNLAVEEKVKAPEGWLWWDQRMEEG